MNDNTYGAWYYVQVDVALSHGYAVFFFFLVNSFDWNKHLGLDLNLGLLGYKFMNKEKWYTWKSSKKWKVTGIEGGPPWNDSKGLGQVNLEVS